MVRIPGLLERIQQPIYDTLTVTPDCNTYCFFQEPYNQRNLLDSQFFDYEALKEAGSSRQCPLCRDGLIDGLNRRSSSIVSIIHHCYECSTFYHRSCANEMGGCSTMGCNKKGIPVEPPKVKTEKTLYHTNMEYKGVLGPKKNFEVHGLDLSFDRTISQDYIDLFKEFSYLSFYTSNYGKDKVCLELPVNVLEQAKGLLSNGYTFAEPIDIFPQAKFRVDLTFHGSKKINISFQIKCALHGFFKREVH